MLLFAGYAFTSCNNPAAPSYEGTYIDGEDGGSVLSIVSRKDGNFDVAVSIFRLTTLDDGIGSITDKCLSFTATDANGDPIGGIVTVDGDTATVTFTDSTWPLLESGTCKNFRRAVQEI